MTNFIYVFIYLFIYLFSPCRVLAAARGILAAMCGIFSCDMWTSQSRHVDSQLRTHVGS